jgi:hypothetical protein
MLEMLGGPVDGFLHKIRFRYLSDHARRAVVGGIGYLITHKKLLPNNTQAFTSWR